MSHALPSVPLTVTAWTCIAEIVVLPTTFLKSLSEVAWLSAVSVIRGNVSFNLCSLVRRRTHGRVEPGYHPVLGQ